MEPSSTGVSPQSLIGRSLSHYTVLEELHRGEMQVVYRARDEKLGREVALKVLPPELVKDPERRERFVAEAKASASLEHPHIAVIHEIDQSEGVVFIAMELMRGPSLAARLAAGPLPPVEAVDVGIDVAAGLAFAHGQGIVHRDVKPANVMLTGEGHPKLIDFGLAKLLDAEQSPFLGHAGEDEPLQGPTREGSLAGTVSFMSPEQTRGGRVDQRSDVFGFGLLLYTMLTGRPPFAGASRVDTLHAILREPTPKLSGLTGEAREVVQPIVDRCLAKEPNRRYQTMALVLEDLRRARLRLEAGGGLSRRARRALWAAALVGFLAAAAMLLPDGAPAPDASEKPSLAVLPFENLTGDPALDWLRTGLPDMLVTDLSQSPALEVVGLDRLHPILEEMDRPEGRPISRDALEEVARRTGARSVLLGSFAKAGDAIRISARLEDAATGEVLLAEKAEATGEENIFRLVDEITGRIRARFEIASRDDELDRDLREVTTASVAAYRAYAEGIRLHERFREEEAIPHFQRAIELDPGFAMALAKLGVVMSNLGLHEEADEYAERALEHVDRLSERERFYIEGWYYSRRPQTLARAIDAYRKAIALYPDHGSARHNLGNLLFATEHYQEAIEQLEELRSRGMLFPATYEQLATAYKALDEVDRARRVLEDYNRRNPDDFTTLLSLAQLEIETGRVEAGEEAIERAEELGAAPIRIAPVRWEADVLREQWKSAAATAEDLMETQGQVEKFLAGRLLATTALYRGEIEPVMRAIDRFVAGVEGHRTYRSGPLLLKAKILIEIGDYRAARQTVLGLSETEDRYGVANDALLVNAIAAQHLGEDDEASRLSREYQRRLDPALGPGPERLYHFLEGELAMERGDFREAISQFNEAESMLPPRGTEGVHTLIWYSLATAHRLQGNEGEAIDWYERIVEATGERLFEPIRYVRSFYFLGALKEKVGDVEAAHANYDRFLDHWAGGEIDRERVAEARAALR